MTHNTFMQVVMNLGIVGITIVLLQFFSTVAASIRRSELSLFLGAVMVPIIINSFTEFGVFGESNYGILFYQLLICIIVLKPKAKLLPYDRRKYERAGGRIPHQDWYIRPAKRKDPIPGGKALPLGRAALPMEGKRFAAPLRPLHSIFSSLRTP